MIRKILCQACNQRVLSQHAEDVINGWRTRVMQIQVKKPAQHQIKIFTGDGLQNLKLKETRDLPSIVCDHCNIPIKDGEPAFALTSWREAREAEPGPWEEEFHQPAMKDQP